MFWCDGTVVLRRDSRRQNQKRKHVPGSSNKLAQNWVQKFKMPPADNLTKSPCLVWLDLGLRRFDPNQDPLQD